MPRRTKKVKNSIRLHGLQSKQTRGKFQLKHPSEIPSDQGNPLCGSEYHNPNELLISLRP